MHTRTPKSAAPPPIYRGEIVVPMERVTRMIHLIRGHKVMIDADLAALYEVEVKVLNQAIKRNIERFPEDFMFQLTAEEAARLRSQTVTLKTGRGQHRKYLPYAFTEQGVAMLSARSSSIGPRTAAPPWMCDGPAGRDDPSCHEPAGGEFTMTRKEHIAVPERAPAAASKARLASHLPQ